MCTKSRWFAVVVILLSGGAQAWASSPCGIFARIDEVSVGPSQEQPTWILIKGDFLVVLTSRRLVGPTRGYLCFSFEPSAAERSGAPNSRAPLAGKHKERCLIEWGDLQRLVEEMGKGKAYVAFGSVFSETFHNNPDVWETADQARQNPFPYPVHHGLTRLRVPASQERAAIGRDREDRSPVLVLQEFQSKKEGASP